MLDIHSMHVSGPGQSALMHLVLSLDFYCGCLGSGGSRGVSAVSAETPFVSLLSTSRKFTEDE